MKYTILEISPGNIKVRYEDNSWANVPIAPNASLEDIDDAVSKYDPDFLRPAESVINQEISVGEERTSTKKPTQEGSSKSFTPSMPLISFGMHIGGDVMAMAEYYSSQGDNTLKEYVMSRVAGYVTENNLTVDKIISNIQYYDSDDDIVAQAESELS